MLQQEQETLIVIEVDSKVRELLLKKSTQRVRLSFVDPELPFDHVNTLPFQAHPIFESQNDAQFTREEFVSIQSTLYIHKNITDGPVDGSVQTSIPLLNLNPLSCELRIENQPPVKLTRIEMNIMVRLYQSYGLPITRKTLIEFVWPGTAVKLKSFDVHMCNLRKKVKRADLSILFSAPDSYALQKL